MIGASTQTIINNSMMTNNSQREMAAKSTSQPATMQPLPTPSLSDILVMVAIIASVILILKKPK